MTEVVRMSATELVCTSEVWVSEFTAELRRDGKSEEEASRRARHLLGRIVRHCGWPRNVYLYDEEEST